MNGQVMISLGAIGLISAAVIISSIRRLPDLGIFAALMIISWLVWRRPGGLEQLGFTSSDNWPGLILVSLLLGGAISLFAVVVLEPLIERLTGKPHDYRLLDPVRGNRAALLQLVALVWALVAFLEEIVFRGFLMNEIALLIGSEIPATIVNLLFTSLLFGMAHWYQGPSGVWSTGVLGLLLGAVFVWAGFNIWPVVIIHGVVDTLALILIYTNQDTRLKHAFIKPTQPLGVKDKNATDEPSRLD